MAALVCLSATGCVSTGLFGPDCGDACAGPCGEACHVATSRRAPRPTLFRNAARPSGRLFGQGGACNDGGCLAANCFGACNCEGCACGGPCQRIAEKVANGFCGCSPVGHGICPHAGGYPEQPAFQPGPPTGQVAYPYYTTRGPRDFLLANPPSIGPR
ncbi:MAG TPA: hypothetical protein VF175_15155 [Lacipirellula sp.]